MQTKPEARLIKLPNGDAVKSSIIHSVRWLKAIAQSFGQAPIPDKVLIEYGPTVPLQRISITCACAEEARSMRDSIIAEIEGETK